MKREFGFAIVGTGLISTTHYEQISAIEGAKVVAVYSRSEQKAKALAEKTGTDWYTNYQEMLKRKEIDIVSIITPSGTHADMAIEAARAGKHVIVEKPMDISLEKAQQMIDVCREHHVKLSVISQHRFDPSSVKVKADIDSGRFGKMVLGQSSVNWYRPQSYYDTSKWRGTLKMDGGGVLINQAIHTIDLFQYFMGEVESVYAHTAILAHEGIEVEDVAVATVKFKHGGLGTIVGTTAAYPGLSARLEIIGTNGTAVIENDQLIKHYLRNSKNETEAINLAEMKSPNRGDLNAASGNPAALDGSSHRLQFIDMINAVKEDREPLVNGEEGLKPLKIISAIYQSARTGQPVNMVDF
ncbi:Gfo/Idh/MocA family oxidoreductase [Neobacillus niacini]|uniref:Gfo/Idh/MocA family protein n=1 Tax=Neobacillus niacini TaxID=86668 RepID=UPI0007ABBD5D|nr:Gfo/Idh/MocA family oxidoreductase [Neobacillus niacini]MEC1523752.1 Gfo/Idh/MocA family oxidoreductase [Neobacillus niacini]